MAEGLVTVIVSCCGQLEYTRLCAPSLLRYSRQPFELLFLDCDSLDGTSEYLEGLAAGSPARIEIAHVSADPPVGPARKDESIPIRGAFVALLNNDTIVTQGWLESLVSLASYAADIGMVAPMSSFACRELLVDPIPYSLDLPIRHSGTPETFDVRPARLLAEIEKVNAFARDWREKNRGQSFEAESLSGGCVLLRREVLQRLGTFPSRTPLGIFDTDTLGIRVRQAGYRLLGCREVFLHNFGSRGLPRAS
jgi:Glycosyltransferase like family 2